MNLFIYKEPLKGHWEQQTIPDWRFSPLGFLPYEIPNLVYVSSEIFSCECESIIEADKKFTEATGINPVKKSSVVVEILKVGFELEKDDDDFQCYTPKILKTWKKLD